MTDRKQAIREQLAATRAPLMALAERLNAAGPAAWETRVQGDDGRWTARQVFAHLSASEAGQLKTLQGIADGGEGVPAGFDLDRWNNRTVEKQADRSGPDLVAALQASRRDLLATLDALTPEQLDRAGRHGRGDTVTVESIFYRIGEHEQEHVNLMERVLKKA